MKKTIGKVAAGIAGAAVVAGVAVAAMTLKNEKTRKKVTKVLMEVKDQAIDYVEKMKKEPNVKKGTSEIKKDTKEVKKAIEKT